MRYCIIILFGLLIITSSVCSADTTEAQPETVTEKPILEIQAVNLASSIANTTTNASDEEYTLGAEDIIEILVRRHPEFSDKFKVNKDGKIQYKFVGDIEVAGLAKDELNKKLTNIISQYVVEPEINITILDYKSKVFYVIGEVSRPGKYYMMGNTLSVREAVVTAGLPLMSAAMRKCRLIRPDISGKPINTKVDIYSVLYGGDLKKNINMLPGDVLYVPSTVMAKVMRVISPVTAPLTNAASTGKTVVSAGAGIP
ncbi:MAG: polysaccharide biosynthesis/export family protein [Candidatus Omnitrophota bacterium]